jgi:hypothetical protein
MPAHTKVHLTHSGTLPTLPRPRHCQRLDRCQHVDRHSLNEKRPARLTAGRGSMSRCKLATRERNVPQYPTKPLANANAHGKSHLDRAVVTTVRNTSRPVNRPMIRAVFGRVHTGRRRLERREPPRRRDVRGAPVLPSRAIGQTTLTPLFTPGVFPSGTTTPRRLRPATEDIGGSAGSVFSSPKLGQILDTVRYLTHTPSWFGPSDRPTRSSVRESAGKGAAWTTPPVQPVRRPQAPRLPTARSSVPYRLAPQP